MRMLKALSTQQHFTFETKRLNKILNIQALRGIAALSVVAFHLVPIEDKYGSGESVLPEFFKFGMFGVDLFFVISGFVMVSITKGQFQSGPKAFNFLYHRVSRIYPTYWFYSALVLAVFLIKPTWVNSAQGNQVNILSSFLLWPESTLPLINVGWTLIHEMYFYLMFSVLLVFLPEKNFGLSLTLWGVTVVVINLGVATSNPVLNLVAHPLTLEFIAGCFLAMLFRDDTGWKNTIILTAVAVLIVAVLTALSESEFPDGWWRVGIYGVPAAATLYGLLVAERKGLVLNRYLVKLGDASYSIYLVHVLILSAVGRVLYSLSTTFPIGNASMILILTLCVIASGLISYKIVERPLMKVTSKIIDSGRLNKSSKKDALDTRASS
ncbi:MAG: acyltransferase [Porticoccaceae bacterium]|nr:acyltransferase [Porticoccaceae bacterium]